MFIFNLGIIQSNVFLFFYQINIYRNFILLNLIIYLILYKFSNYEWIWLIFVLNNKKIKILKKKNPF